MDKLGNIKAMGKKQQQRPIVSWEKVMRLLLLPGGNLGAFTPQKLE